MTPLRPLSSLEIIGRMGILFAFLASVVSGAPKAPPWMSSAAAANATVDYSDASHAVLLDEDIIDVSVTGKQTLQTRKIIRVLTSDGKKNAQAHVLYNSDRHKVKSFQAWTIRKSGEVIKYSKKHIVDAALYNALVLYSDNRVLIIDAEEDAQPGSVFGYEAILEENSIYSQKTWSFHDSAPVECSRITFNLPAGWTVEGRTFNRETIPPQVQGRSFSWELRGLPALKDEPLAPSLDAWAPWIAFDLQPPPNTHVRLKTFLSWSDISSYHTPDYERGSAVDATVKARADALVAGKTTLWERLTALAAHAQKVTYISILLNSASGGGWVPQPATKVLACNYGDCKDKATLLRALLKSQGIESYPVVVYSGDPDRVRPEWPSPHQFNHCILAIKVDETVNMPAVVVHPTFGRLLLFDPTNPHMPVGWLPEEDTGGRGLLIAGLNGELIDLPKFKNEENRVDRKIAARLYSDGSAIGTIEEHFYGAASVKARATYKETSSTDYNEELERGLSRTLSTPRVKHIEVTDDFDDAKFSRTIQFETTAYGRTMRDALLTFKPVMLAGRSDVLLRKEKRVQPVEITPSHLSETVEITLPDGYQVDELPSSVDLTSEFGRYISHTEVRDGNRVFLERTVELNRRIFPPEQYETARVFFSKTYQASQTPVVLRRAEVLAAKN